VEKLRSLICLLFLFCSLVAESEAAEKCWLKQGKQGFTDIFIGQKNAPAPVISESAKILVCKVWKDFPHLRVVELYIGEGGTTSIQWRTDFLVFDTRAAELKTLYQRILSSGPMESSKKKGAATLQFHYSLGKSKDGKPEIAWKESDEKVILN